MTHLKLFQRNGAYVKAAHRGSLVREQGVVSRFVGPERRRNSASLGGELRSLSRTVPNIGPEGGAELFEVELPLSYTELIGEAARNTAARDLTRGSVRDAFGMRRRGGS